MSKACPVVCLSTFYMDYILQYRYHNTSQLKIYYASYY